MEQYCEPSYDRWSPAHEYPDPDSAAYITKYPWFGEENDYVPPRLPNGPEGAWPGSGQDQPTAQAYQSHFWAGPRDTVFDPDYEASDDGAPEDDIISDGDSENSTESAEIFDDIDQALPPLPPDKRRTSETRAPRGRGAGRRGRRGGLGRGGKGIKRGPRKAIEPTEEFKALQSQAILAFLSENDSLAEQLILQAIQINPEMFEAHNLLSEIHYARGDLDKAIGAAWTAAHTKQRDSDIWSRLADLILERGSDDRKSTLRNAVYCINRIVNLDKYNVKARYQRANLYQELGYKRRAVIEYEELIKQLPHDTIVLRHLAEIYIELENPERALEHYRYSITHFQAIEPDDVSTFTWSDVNIVTELYGFQQRYEEGIVQLKSLSRWLLGRKEDSIWETFDEDDREWDLDDRPRRTELLGFVPGEYDAASYGDALPLDLRIKLGIYRLKAGSHDIKEALNHFEWLDSDDGQSLYECTDLFREAANALRGLGFHQEALRFYEPLQKVSGYDDVSYLFEMASCYRAVGLKPEAESCYQRIIERDTGNYEARIQLSGMRQGGGMTHWEDTHGNHGGSVRQHKSMKRGWDRDAKRSKKITTTGASSSSMVLAPRPANQSIKQLAVEQEQVQEEELRSLFLQREMLKDGATTGDKDGKAEWMAATEALIQGFRDNKVFYPAEKHHKFLGYSKEARAMASRTKHGLYALTEGSRSIFETADGQQIVVPDEYCGVPFHVWLDLFLDYALEIARSGDIDSAYDIIASAFHANVFNYSSESLFLVHVCWFTCALMGNDDETLCNIARWFMKEYQFVTDGYRLFSALNRLCDSENSWYNSGPSQKYILRQLKAVDFSLLGDAPRKTMFQERASYSTKDSNGNSIRAAHMDVPLLMLYGHILHAGKSYAFAVNYYLRALTLDPGNPMIKLSLALGYLHYALKRQADNRHHILTQGLALLLEYYDARSRSSSASERQEAEYNVAHAYHLLGLTHLAILYYERCLDLSTAVQTASLSCQAEDFAVEAAVNLQCHWAATGNVDKAREVTEKWLVIGTRD